MGQQASGGCGQHCREAMTNTEVSVFALGEQRTRGLPVTPDQQEALLGVSPLLWSPLAEGSELTLRSVERCTSFLKFRCK